MSPEVPYPFSLKELDPRKEAGHPRGVGRSGLESVGECVRHLTIQGITPRPPGDERIHFNTPLDPESSDPLGTKKGLMAGDGDEVRPGLPEAIGKVPGPLGCVHENQSPGISCQPRHGR